MNAIETLAQQINVSPLIKELISEWCDALKTDAERDRVLGPLMPLLAGTRSTADVEWRREMMAADWLIRVQAPTWLRLAGLDTIAASMEEIPEITKSAKSYRMALIINGAKRYSNSAMEAFAATGGSASTGKNAINRAAWDATGATGGSAITRAARGTWAVWDAWEATWNAARIAVASGADLQPTIVHLQHSAVDLVRQMIVVNA